MIAYKRRQLEREQLVRDIAIASTPVFLGMVLEQSLKHKASQQQVQDLRQTAAECAWTHGEIMARVKP